MNGTMQPYTKSLKAGSGTAPRMDKRSRPGWTGGAGGISVRR